VAFKLLQPTPFQDADRVATLPAFARVHGLRTMSDSKKLGSFTYGGPPENQTRYQGIVEMRQAHGLDNVFVPYPVGDQYQPLNRHRVDTIAIFTTDGQLLARHYAIQRPRSAALGPPAVPSCFRSHHPLRHWPKRAGRGALCAFGYL
jgi:glycine betaine/choline ABC-type transport system substrate-binding protein